MSEHPRSRPFAVYSSDDPEPCIEIREPLRAYPSLADRQDCQAWLASDDDKALAALDAFITSHNGELDLVPAARDISVFLCDWVVTNVPEATWILHRDGFSYVALHGNQVDPFRTVLQCLTNKQPIAVRFGRHCQTMS